MLNENSSIREMINYMNNDILINRRLELLTENKISDVTNALKNVYKKTGDAINKLPKPNIKPEDADKIKRGIADVLGFAVEQWNDEENQTKLKEVANVLGNGVSKISNASGNFFTNSEKMASAIRGLNLAKYLPIIGVVYGVLHPADVGYVETLKEALTGIDIWHWNPSEWDFSSLWGADLNVVEKFTEKFATAINFALLGLGLWLMEIVVKFIQGASDLIKLVGGMVSFIFKFVKFVFSSIFKVIMYLIKKSKKKNTKNPNDVPMTVEPQINEPRVDDDGQPAQENVNLFNKSHELIKEELLAELR